MMPLLLAAALGAGVLEPAPAQQLVETFNAGDAELYTQAIPNAHAWEWLRGNIPLFDCPDAELVRTWYFRWWTYRKHLKQTPDGWVITEFLPAVPWAGKYNAIPCPAGHHLYEGRWLADQTPLHDDMVYWFRKGGEPRRYSFWAADALLARTKVTGDWSDCLELLPDLVANWEAWDRTHRDANGLYWQNDGADGMEVSVGGTGYRVTLNTYQYGDALAIAEIAERAGKADVAQRFRRAAALLKSLVQERLWDPQARFFKVAPRATGGEAKSAGILEWRVNHDLALTQRAVPTASTCWTSDTVAALNDGREPANSGDTSLPRQTFWDHVGTEEWVQYAWPEPVRLDSTQVYWFQDTAGCRVPSSWAVEWFDGDAWRPVTAPQAHGVVADRYNEASFEPVTTKALRLRIKLRGAELGSATDPLRLANVRELHGLTPWYMHLPDPEYDVAWRQLTDPQGFQAPFGPTTCERRHPGFQVSREGHECQWNGPSWPFATSVTLTALANLLHDRPSAPLTRQDYFDTLQTYSRSQRLKRPDGTVVPWIDENLDPLTGEWLARSLLLARGAKPLERGKDYNHSTFCDLVISGLVGLIPRTDQQLVVDPLLPAGRWDWFCLDRVPYHGHLLTIVWDRTGQHYGRGQGLRVLVDQREVAVSATLARVTALLP